MDYDDYVTHMEIKLEGQKMDSIPDGLDRCDSCTSLVYSDTNECPACGGKIVKPETIESISVTLMEIEREIQPFILDLRTMAFYTGFLFTKESRAFRYSLMREPV